MTRTRWDTEAEIDAPVDSPRGDYERAARLQVEAEEEEAKKRRIAELAKQKEEAERAREERLTQALADLDMLRPLVQEQAQAAEDARQALAAAVETLTGSLEKMRSATAAATVWPYQAEAVCRRQEIDAAIASGRSILDAVMKPRRLTEADLDRERRENIERRKAERDAAERKRTISELLDRAREADAYGNTITANDLRRQARAYGWDGRE